MGTHITQLKYLFSQNDFINSQERISVIVWLVPVNESQDPSPDKIIQYFYFCYHILYKLVCIILKIRKYNFKQYQLCQ